MVRLGRVFLWGWDAYVYEYGFGVNFVVLLLLSMNAR